MQRPRFVRSGRNVPSETNGHETPHTFTGAPADASSPPRPAPNGPGQGLDLEGGRVPALVAEDVQVTRSLIGRVRARSVGLRQGATGVALGRDVTVQQGGGWLMAGAKLNVDGGAAQWLVGGLVQARQVFAIAVVAGRVEGQVKCLFDARGAFAFGAGAALATGMLRLFTRRR